MALFLNEAYEQHIGGTTSMTELHEAAFALLELSQKQAALNEGILIADYIIEKQCRNLSEGETTDKIKDFGRKVWHNVKAFAKTVYAKIKEIIALVWRKLKEWGSKVLDMFSDEKSEKSISKRRKYILEELPRLIEKLIYAAEKGMHISEGGAERTKELIDDIEKEIGELKTKANDMNGEEKVGKNWLKSVENSLDGLVKKLTKANEAMGKTADQAEKVAARMKDSDNSTEASAAITSFRESIKAVQRCAIEVTGLTSKLPLLPHLPPAA